VKTMRVAQIPKAGADFEIVEREIPKPGSGHVRIRVQACGVCHSDVLTKEGGWPGLGYPRVPGHEVAGVIDDVGSGVTQWTNGQRVGVGWHGGHDGTCLACRRGDFVNCANVKVTGLSYDGGYGEYMIAPAEAVVRMPESLDPVDAAPLLCAGITTFNALRHSGAQPSDLVAVQGIGGLGHLGLILAAKEAVKHFGAEGGSIVNISSVASTAAPPNASVYSATKAAVDAVTRSLAKELGPRKIRVNAINPGMVETEGFKAAGLHESDFRKQAEAQTPLGRIGQPEDIAPAAVFLASPDSAWITGETLHITGGLR
jgi:NAD(P)-dependent dehydrogenase (short-subunit alcohol dehydrogenase family)